MTPNNVPNSLDGQVAVVTGAASGMGRAIALAYAEAGAAVVAGDLDEAGLAQTRALAADPEAIRTLRADVSDDAQVAALVALAVADFGRLTIICNNAGVPFRGTAETTTREQFDRVIAVNLTGVFLGCKHAVPAMRAAGGGAIVNVASAAAVVGGTELVAYCASKGGVLALTRAVALDHAREGIRANCILPGSVMTAMLESDCTQSELDAIATSHPIGRVGRPEEIAQAAVFLSSPASSFMTGSAVTVDGGLTAH